MASRSVPITESISWGWQQTLKNWALVIPFFLLFGIVIGGLTGLQTHAVNSAVNDNGFLSFLQLVAEMLFVCATIRLGLGLYAGETPTWSSIFQFSAPQLVKVLVASLLLGVISFLGMLLLVIPGIYWGLAYHFTPYAIVEHDSGIMDAFGFSGRITKGVKWQLIGFGLVSAGVLILGAIVLGVGLLWAIPTVSLAHVYIYKKLSEGEAAPAAAPSVK